VRFTFDDLLKMRAAEVFREGEHVELVDGEFVILPSEGTFHLHAVRLMIEWLARLVYGDPELDAKWGVYSHATLLFSDGNRREPDTYVGPRLPRTEFVPPAAVALLFEAATTSTDKDLGEKRLQYAKDGVQEYWVYETEPQLLTVFRDPVGGDYAFRKAFKPGETISPLFAPGAAFDCAVLAER
jgi:Uma2 family endonuclease